LEDNTFFWERLSSLTKVATVLFCIGKLTGVMSMIALLASPMLAMYTGIVYAALIGTSILLCLIQMSRTKKQRNKPTREQVEAWAREYSLLEGR